MNIRILYRKYCNHCTLHFSIVTDQYNLHWMVKNLIFEVFLPSTAVLQLSNLMFAFQPVK